MNAVQMQNAGMAKSRTNYHHGDLKDALVKAADAIIREHGIEGFSLREAARRAGVSPGAPAHHFGTIKGLLTEVALLGYETLGSYLAREPATGEAEKDLAVLSQAYIQFALDHPGQFRLMFRNDLVNREDPRYRATSSQALEPFAAAAKAFRSTTTDGLDQPVRIFALWSAIHGMAHLVLEEKANALFGATNATELARNTLPTVLGQIWSRV